MRTPTRRASSDDNDRQSLIQSLIETLGLLTPAERQQVLDALGKSGDSSNQSSKAARAVSHKSAQAAMLDRKFGLTKSGPRVTHDGCTQRFSVVGSR